MAQRHPPHEYAAGSGSIQLLQESQRAETPRLSAPKTILVVDDQPTVCGSIAFYLEVCGYQTKRADSGLAAIELVGGQPIDGVLLDVQMPGLNGFQTCVRLHETSRAANRRLKIWFMTGINYRELPDDCTKAGGLGVFHKPFDWPVLLAELERGLNDSPVDAKLTDDVASGSSQNNGPAAPGATGAALTFNHDT